jgi:hypothetical protein
MPPTRAPPPPSPRTASSASTDLPRRLPLQRVHERHVRQRPRRMAIATRGAGNGNASDGRISSFMRRGSPRRSRPPTRPRHRPPPPRSPPPRSASRPVPTLGPNASSGITMSSGPMCPGRRPPQPLPQPRVADDEDRHVRPATSTARSNRNSIAPRSRTTPPPTPAPPAATVEMAAPSCGGCGADSQGKHIKHDVSEVSADLRFAMKRGSAMRLPTARNHRKSAIGNPGTRLTPPATSSGRRHAG